MDLHATSHSLQVLEEESSKELEKASNSIFSSLSEFETEVESLQSKVTEIRALKTHFMNEFQILVSRAAALESRQQSLESGNLL